MIQKYQVLNTQRRVLCLGLALLPAWSFAVPQKQVVEMWKSPTCGCCQDWANYMEVNGFVIKVHTDGNDEIRKKLGMPIQFGSCHTALIGGYAIEGHVPAKEIKRLLSEKPKAIGLTVPAMPVGSPGMDSPEYKGRKDPYDVLLIALNGKPSVYQSYR
ncbi:DUF411 domain-containing protein [Polynucleobacter brandtiae]|uniref:DUF411 domain-containing protein n=1 Tax=Polynucleobacter brandtiae TaxID=1938816 RepID=A0A2M8VIK1_9BURK|nr:DUF411 domain-containing protein [Polynucleobacter brandtiae]PJI76679.1 hypothetical protein B0G85_1883 [Polynucleobacter brandtiae]